MVVQEEWGMRVKGQMRDSRGWGRWSGVVVGGKDGRDLVVLSVYNPTRGGCEGSMWERQKERMVGEGQWEPNPRRQLLRDLGEVLERESGRGRTIIVEGDLNLPVRRGDCGGREEREEWDAWGELWDRCGMRCISEELWGDKGTVWTFEKGGGRGWIAGTEHSPTLCGA